MFEGRHVIHSWKAEFMTFPTVCVTFFYDNWSLRYHRILFIKIFLKLTNFLSIFDDFGSVSGQKIHETVAELLFLCFFHVEEAIRVILSYFMGSF